MGARTLAAVLAVAVGAPATLCRAEVLLLGNGALVEGRVEREGDEVVVHQGDGAIRLRTESVAAVTASRIEAYDWLRTRELAGQAAAGDHLRLADWAMRHQMWPQAARELLEARQLEPDHPRLQLLQRRLTELSRPASRPHVVEHTRDFSPAEDVASTEPQLELPHDGLPYFTRHIQPVLLNGCALAGCHRGGEGDRFPLDVSLLHGYGNAAATGRNLQTALAAIDTSDPTSSPLLQAARGPHAGQTPFKGLYRAEILARLEQWANDVAAANGWEAEFVDQPADVVVETVDSTPPTEPAVQPATFESAERQAPQRGLRLKRVEPRDEFDPAIFNERYRRPEDDEPPTP